MRSRARPPRKFEIKSAAATATAAADRELCQQQSREREGAGRRQSRQPNERLKTKDQPCKKFLQKRANHSPLPLSIPIAAGRDILGNVRVRRRVVILCTQTASSPDSESSFLFQILKLMEGRWTRAPSAMPAGQASRRVTRAFSSTSDGGGGGRCDRPSQYLLLTAFRYMERRRRREERGEGRNQSALLAFSSSSSPLSSPPLQVFVSGLAVGRFGPAGYIGRERGEEPPLIWRRIPFDFVQATEQRILFVGRFGLTLLLRPTPTERGVRALAGQGKNQSHESNVNECSVGVTE